MDNVLAGRSAALPNVCCLERTRDGRAKIDLEKLAKDLFKAFSIDEKIERCAVTSGKPRAIDLYSGVGGWSLGLRLAGVEVVASYERWGPANETNFKNNSHQAQTVDIRRLAFDDLPTDIDIVVGSPPCTQFSFSNRGGGGNIDDGLEDIIQFLKIVDHLKPRVWAMENVPRVAKIIQAELAPGGRLADFAHLGCATHIVDMAEYGVPQRRRRCIAGDFNATLLESYKVSAKAATLGDVVRALAEADVVDPLYGLAVPKGHLTEHVREVALGPEEVRINRASKVKHTVYNAMAFPDRQDRPVRTITATCTRVSRESIVIATDDDPNAFRRLTLRERASLQGFPVTFQFYGANYGQKLRMIGNAVPPAFTYLMGHMLQDHGASEVADLTIAAKGLTRPGPTPVETPPDKVGTKYPDRRTFRFAIPSLQLKSGVRFELKNGFVDDVPVWGLAFYFGTSKAILGLSLNDALHQLLLSKMSETLRAAVATNLKAVHRYVEAADIANMQHVWTHKGPGGTRPFMLLDKIDELGESLEKAVSKHAQEAKALIDAALDAEYGDDVQELPGVQKLHRNAGLILAGMLIGSHINPVLSAKGRSVIDEARSARG
jgi:DNA (cytosine-5)-methyltransferase 1